MYSEREITSTECSFKRKSPSGISFASLSIAIILSEYGYSFPQLGQMILSELMSSFTVYVQWQGQETLILTNI
jgi:hypothetical protein